jgi:gas vesicle protein
MENVEKKYLVIGGLLGAMLGVAAAWMLLRNAPESGERAEPVEPPGARDLINLVRGLLEVLRQVVDVRERLPAKK